MESGANLVTVMSKQSTKFVRFGAAIALIVLALGYIAYTGVAESKMYYVKVSELKNPDNSLYSKHLRLVGNVQPGSIHQVGTNADFVLVDMDNNAQTQRVSYKGAEPPPDTFKDNAQALAIGHYGKDGVFYATELQAKCASKYAPQQQGAPAQPQSKGY
jgi:cytochrome c-type biogenesis protein CcmE